MIEKYAIRMRTGRTVPTGQYEINRFKRRVAVTKYMEEYLTDSGCFTCEKWKELALAEVKADGKEDLLSAVKEYCKRNCAWLRNDKEIEDYALECTASHAYEHWSDFHYPQQPSKLT